MRVSRMVDFTASRARAAAATSGLSCSCIAVKASSVLASAGTCFSGLLGLGFMGVSTPRLSSRAENFGELASSVRTASSSSSTVSADMTSALAMSDLRRCRANSSMDLRFWSRSIDAATSSMEVLTSSWASTNIRIVASICHNSLAE